MYIISAVVVIEILYLTPSPNRIHRILVIRAGALGDTLLMLPLIRTLRRAFPQAYLEVMGYVERLQIALGESYAHRVSSIDRSDLQTFFVKGATLPADLVRFFGSFDLILSYKQDPEGFWTENLRKTGARHVYSFSPFPPEQPPVHIVSYLLSTLTALNLKADEEPPKVYPPSWAREEALKFWKENQLPVEGERPVLAIHPGSGSVKKVWPPERFAQVCRKASEQYQARILVVSGPADAESVQKVLRLSPNINPIPVENKPLLVLSAILERCQAYLGNDSGVTHLAAAVGIPVIALFGPTNPQIWRPLGERVKVLQAGVEMVNFNPAVPLTRDFHKGLEALKVETIMEALSSVL